MEDAVDDVVVLEEAEEEEAEEEEVAEADELAELELERSRSRLEDAV